MIVNSFSWLNVDFLKISPVKTPAHTGKNPWDYDQYRPPRLA